MIHMFRATNAKSKKYTTGEMLKNRIFKIPGNTFNYSDVNLATAECKMKSKDIFLKSTSGLFCSMAYLKHLSGLRQFWMKS